VTSFHEILFPLDIALKSAGGPQRRTDVVTLGSGAEERNARWAHSRRRYDAGYGVKTFEALSQVVAFFEERRGRLYGFRWRDRLDHSSAATASIPASGGARRFFVGCSGCRPARPRSATMLSQRREPSIPRRLSPRFATSDCNFCGHSEPGRSSAQAGAVAWPK